ncbi:MAG: alpha/beta hydrolase [Rhodobacterales bacterium]
MKGTGMARFEKTTLESPSGATLNLRSMLPDGASAVVQVHHGMGEHSARYARFAQALSGAGYAVYVQDLRGYGATIAPDAPLGVLAASGGFEVLAADALAVNDHIRSAHPGLPVVVFGHSMGSILSLYFAMKHPDRMDALACWNSGVDGGALVAISGLILGTERLFRGANAPSKIAMALTFDTWNKAFKPNRTAFDWLSRDDAEVDLYVADPLCGFAASTGLWLDLLGAVKFGGDDQNLARLPKGLPVHLLGGGDDPCSDKGRAMQRLAARMVKVGMQDVTAVVLPKTRHESLNEVNRDQTTQDFLNWLKAHLK